MSAMRVLSLFVTDKDARSGANRQLVLLLGDFLFLFNFYFFFLDLLGARQYPVADLAQS